MTEKKRIGELLVWDGLVTKEQVDEALSVQKEKGGKIVAILINLGHLDEDDFLRFLAQRAGVPNINIANYEIGEDIINLVPADLARKHELLPIDKLGRLLTVAMVCPLDQATLDELSERTGLKIKPVLCSATDVREGIERYYGRAKTPTEVQPEVQPEAPPVTQPVAPAAAEPTVVPKAALHLSGVTEIIKRIDALPTLPAVLERIRAEMADPLSSASDVARIISGDPAIASKVLQVANSAAYGYSRKIADISQAVAWLGLRETYQIALSVRALEMMAVNKRFDYELFRKHSAQCAAAASVLAKRCALKDSTGIFAAGLLHDIGKLVLVDAMPERYIKLAARIEEEGSDSVVIEEEELGVSHAEVGHLLADHWQFPLEISEAIRLHHKPELAQTEPRFTAVIALANKVANDAAAGQDTDTIAGKYTELQTTLELTFNSAAEAIQRYVNRSHEIEVF
jgi:putative nucleotidyltransferase with HDIG domain